MIFDKDNDSCVVSPHLCTYEKDIYWIMCCADTKEINYFLL